MMQTETLSPETLPTEQSEKPSTTPEKTPRLKTIDEVKAAGLPWLKVADQFYAAEKWPSEHRKCKGLGYTHIILKYSEKLAGFGANSKCFCNSGLKYKKCCRTKVERLRRSGQVHACECVGDVYSLENPQVEALKADMKGKIQDLINLGT